MDGRLGVIPVISHVLTRRLQALRYQGQASGAESTYRATWSLSGAGLGPGHPDQHSNMIQTTFTDRETDHYQGPSCKSQ